MYSGKRILTNEVTTDEIYESGSANNSVESTNEIYKSPSSDIYEELAVYSRPHFYDSIHRNEQNPPPSSPLPPFKEPPKQQRLKQLKISLCGLLCGCLTSPLFLLIAKSIATNKKVAVPVAIISTTVVVVVCVTMGSLALTGKKIIKIDREVESPRTKS